MPRTAQITRKTAETDIALALDLDGSGKVEVSSGVGFFDHMLTHIARHGLFDLSVRCKGDTHIDAHHTVEDVGICFGKALAQALGDKAGIRRFGDCALPMDETLTRVALDVSGRPYLIWRVKFPSAKIGEFDTELFREWFQAFAQNAGLTLHVENLYGENSHHIAESCYKGLARALRAATLFFDWPDRPDEVDIHLDGPDEMHYWTCKYSRGELTDLNFDNN